MVAVDTRVRHVNDSDLGLVIELEELLHVDRIAVDGLSFGSLTGLPWGALKVESIHQESLVFVLHVAVKDLLISVAFDAGSPVDPPSSVTWRTQLEAHLNGQEFCMAVMAASWSDLYATCSNPSCWISWARRCTTASSWRPFPSTTEAQKIPKGYTLTTNMQTSWSSPVFLAYP